MHKHDALWKELLRMFFPDFLEFVVPEIAAKLRPHDRRFLEQEAFTDIPGGRSAQMDLVAEVPAHEGPNEIVLVHIEVEREFGKRMDLRVFRYYMHLKLKMSLPVVPIVLFLRGGHGGVSQRTVEDQAAGICVNRFTYWALGLSAAKAEDFLGRWPLGVALASCTKGDGLPPYERKFRCMETLVDTEVDDAQQMLLLNAVETYLELNEEQKVKYSERVSNNPRKSEVVAMEMTWADKMQERGRQEGVELGRQEGVELGRREGVELGRREGVEVSQRVLLKLLTQRYPQVPQETRRRVQGLEDLTTLESLIDRVFSSSTLEELGLLSSEAEIEK